MSRQAAFAFMLCIAQVACSQTFSARHDFGQSSTPDFGVTIFRSDTGYWIVQQGRISNPYMRMCLASISEDGGVQEIASFGRDGLGCSAGSANGCTVSSYGDLYAGASTDNGSQVDAVVWRISEEFDSLWASFLFPDTSDNSIGRMVRCKDQNSYTIGGVWHGSLSGQMFLSKLDSSGAVHWIQEYGTSIRDEGCSLDTTPDGGFILGGRSWLTDDDFQAYIVKTDSIGTEQWHRHLGGPYKDGWASVICTADSEYVMVGSHATNSSTSKRLYAARLDGEGEIEWQRQYASATEANELSSVTELADGTFIAAGLYFDTTEFQGVLLRFDQNGDSLWMRTYEHPPLSGIFSVHWLLHVIQDQDGSFVATGSCNDGEQDLWVIKVDSFGCLVPGCQLYDNIAEQGIDLNILAYPNPTQGRLFLSFRSAHIPQGEFTLLNSAGQVVQRFQPGGASVEIDYDIGHHPGGVYLLRYQEQGVVQWSQKVIKE